MSPVTWILIEAYFNVIFSLLVRGIKYKYNNLLYRLSFKYDPLIELAKL